MSDRRSARVPLPFHLQGPKRGEVHVWSASLDVPPSVFAGLKRNLSKDELERAGRFRFAQHRTRFIVGHGWLRLLLSCYLARRPEALQFELSAKGKPSLAREQTAGGWFFNLAHTEDLALVAITKAGEVGIDVERVRPIGSADDLVARFFSRRENRAFQELPEAQRPAAFFKLWTRKEAWLKATGEGISNLLGGVEVSFLEAEPARLLRVPPGFGTASNWSLYHLSPKKGYVGALVLAARGGSIICRRWVHEY